MKHKAINTLIPNSFNKILLLFALAISPLPAQALPILQIPIIPQVLAS
jgi:hypothetical protein